MLQFGYKRWRHPCLIKDQPAGINTPSKRDTAASGGRKYPAGGHSFIPSSFTFTRNKHFVALKTNYSQTVARLRERPRASCNTCGGETLTIDAQTRG